MLLQSLLSPDAVHLGSLVLDPSAPHADYHISDSRKVLPSDVAEATAISVQQLLNGGKHSSVSGVLSSLFSARYSDRAQSELLLRAASSRRRQLKNSTEYFEDLCSSKKTRMWLERRVIAKKRPVYLVVGLCLIADAHMQEKAQHSTQIGAKAQLPVSAIVGDAAGALAPYLDASVGAATGGSDSSATKFNTVGEQVYAVEYRKVEFKWFSSGGAIDKAKVERGSRWMVYSRPRGMANSNTPKDDTVEAVLTEVNETELGIPGEITEDGDAEGLVFYYASQPQDKVTDANDN